MRLKKTLNRLSMVLAVLEAHCGVRLSGHDVYLNVAGGLTQTHIRSTPSCLRFAASRKADASWRMKSG